MEKVILGKMDIPQETILNVHEDYLKRLNYLSLPRSKLVILFSGIPGAGKTYVAKKLEERYHGVRVRTDDIRESVHKLVGNKEAIDNLDYTTPIVEQYVRWLVKNSPFENKLIILDRGIDRTYKEIFSLAEREGYVTFLIRIQASRETLERRIFDKNNCRDPHFDREIDRWTREWEDFGKQVKPDILIENERDNELNLKPLFKKLDKLIK